MSNLLFNVTFQVYGWYEELGKEWELRVIKQRYHLGTIYDGRSVQVMKGYTGTSFFGVVDGDPVVGSLDKILDEVDFRKIIPIAGTRRDAIRIINGIIDGEEYIACKIQKV